MGYKRQETPYILLYQDYDTSNATPCRPFCPSYDSSLPRSTVQTYTSSLGWSHSNQRATELNVL